MPRACNRCIRSGFSATLLRYKSTCSCRSLAVKLFHHLGGTVGGRVDPKYFRYHSPISAYPEVPRPYSKTAGARPSGPPLGYSLSLGSGTEAGGTAPGIRGPAPGRGVGINDSDGKGISCSGLPTGGGEAANLDTSSGTPAAPPSLCCSCCTAMGSSRLRVPSGVKCPGFARVLSDCTVSRGSWGSRPNETSTTSGRPGRPRGGDLAPLLARGALAPTSSFVELLGDPSPNRPGLYPYAFHPRQRALAWGDVP